MNSKCKFLLFSLFFFIGSVKATYTDPNSSYEQFLYQQLWFYSQGYYPINDITQTKTGHKIALHRPATLEDVAKKLRLPIKIIIEKMKQWHLKIPTQ